MNSKIPPMGETAGDFLWFRPLIIKWFSIGAACAGWGMTVYGLLSKGPYILFAASVGLVGTICIVLNKFEKYTYSTYLLLFGLSFLVAFRAYSIQSAMCASFLSIIVVVAAIFTNPFFTTLLFFSYIAFIITCAFIGVFSFAQISDPETGLYFVNTITVTLPLIVVSYIVSLVVSKILVATIKKQIDQYKMLEKTQQRLLLQEKLESMRILTGGIAHDFNNILTAILGNLNIIQLKSSEKNESNKYLDSAMQATLRARNLTRQLLTVSKGNVPVKSISSIGEIIRETVNFSLHGSKVKPDFLMSRGLWHVDADRDQIAQVIQNLIINAVQSMTDGGTIKIKTENFRLSDNTDVPLDNGDYIKITIVDEGNGISKEDQSKIFDPFFTTKPDGSGLGLTVCYSIVKNHGGHISVDSEVNKGTTFSIYLPAVHDKASKEINRDVQQKKQSGHVLIMDDDTDVQGALGAMLKELGFDVIASKNGEEALQTYKKYFDKNKKFKFIIMDLTVPAGLGGIEVLKEITKFDPDVKAIVSTGYSESLPNDENKRHGFQAILAKPYTIKELSRAIDTLF